MTLADFFLAVNAAGVLLANVGGRLQLRGPTSAISPAIRAAAAEHKAAILALLPASPPEEAEIEIPEAPACHPAEGARAEAELEAEIRGRERAAIPAEGAGEITPAEAATANRPRGGSAFENGFRHEHEWRDWRLEWLLEVGTLSLRMRGCQDQLALARLRPLAEATPTSLAEWLTLGQQIANAEHELRQRGKLPSYPWPERGES